MLHHFIHFALCGPDIRKKYLLALTIGAECVFPQIDVNPPG